MKFHNHKYTKIAKLLKIAKNCIIKLNRKTIINTIRIHI
jgi:hypothetical protein